LHSHWSWSVQYSICAVLYIRSILKVRVVFLFLISCEIVKLRDCEFYETMAPTRMQKSKYDVPLVWYNDMNKAIKVHPTPSIVKRFVVKSPSKAIAARIAFLTGSYPTEACYLNFEKQILHPYYEYRLQMIAKKFKVALKTLVSMDVACRRRQNNKTVRYKGQDFVCFRVFDRKTEETFLYWFDITRPDKPLHRSSEYCDCIANIKPIDL
jgi:hypothetical protein